jgi:pimeloyl-ACP methyl ester carboxylesterase
VGAQQFVTSHGLQVAMQVQGEGDPLLLINGMTRPLRSWEPFIKELHGRKVVSFDAPGVGASPTPVLPLSMPGLAEIAVAVLEAAGVDEADVLGYSHGGAVAQQLVHDEPGRVRRLVLASTSCGVGASPGNGRDGLRGLRTPTVANAWPRADIMGLFWQSLAFSNWSSIPFLGSISTPTLVVCGSHDRIVAPANSKILARRIPGALLAMVPAGHDLQRPGVAKAFAHVLERFLSAEAETEALPAIC